MASIRRMSAVATLIQRQRFARLSKALESTLIMLALVALLLIMLFPFAIIAMNALKSPAEYASFGPLSLPQGIYLKGLLYFWQRIDFTNKLINSLIISTSVAVFGVGLAALSAFALGIGKVRGHTWIVLFFLIAHTLPHESLAYPLYYFARFLKIYDTQFAVILIFTVIQSAFGTYLLTLVLSTFPIALLEAAVIDGCNKLQLLLWVVIPICKPTLMVLFVFFFIWTWNEFFLPLVMLISSARQTVPLAVALLRDQQNVDVTTLSAAALLGMLPCIIFFLIFQRTLIQGTTAGSIR